MARSLEISKSQIEFDDKGLEKETKKSNFEITVTVDDQKNNGSFTISSVLGDWFTYTIERFEDSSNGYVKIIIKVSKNLSTEDRHGLIKIEHNCANIIKYIEIVQDGVKYSLTSEYTNGWQFKSIPDELYEEKIVELKATNGRGRWYVKEVQQYQVTKGDSFGDATIEYKGLETQDELMRQTRVPYDGVFNYRIERGIDTEADKLIIRSFGQIDLITKQNEIDGHPHMRYFFVLSHCDVNNLNKTALEEKGIKFSDRKLFIFDGDDGNGSEYGEGDKPTVEPSESDSYIFTVNGSKSPLLNMTVEGGTSSPIVISTKNGSNLSYTASLSSSNDWCTINETGTTITINKNEASYRECVIIYTQSGTNEIIKLKVVQDVATENFVFTVNSYTYNFTAPTISVSGSTYSTTVVSKKGNTEIPYSVYQKNFVDWAKYNDGVITVEKNTATEERQVVYVFKQEGGSQKQPIYVTIVQSAASETWVFEVSPNSKVVSSNGETVNLTIKSLHNGEFIAFSAQDISEDWLYYDSSSESIVATSYPYSENGSSRSATITFVQSESNDKKTVTISQNKQETKSAILVFVNDDNSETTAKTIEFEEYSSTVTVKVKSMDDEGLPDSEISTTELPNWITTTSFANEGDGYYTVNITCKTNTSSELTTYITFANSSSKSIVLTVKKPSKMNTITFKAGTNVNSENYFELYVVYLTDGKPDIANKVDSFTFTKNTDKKDVSLEDGKLYFLTYKYGNGEGDLIISQEKSGVTNNMQRIEDDNNKVTINNTDGEIITINTQQYVYELENNTLTVGWYGKYYEEPFAKVYSYCIIEDIKTAIDVKEVKLKVGEFITDMKFSGPYNDDPNGPYYKITIDVSTNETSNIKTGNIVIVNDRNESLELEVEQLGYELKSVDFDYINSQPVTYTAQIICKSGQTAQQNYNGVFAKVTATILDEVGIVDGVMDLQSGKEASNKVSIKFPNLSISEEDMFIIDFDKTKYTITDSYGNIFSLPHSI